MHHNNEKQAARRLSPTQLIVLFYLIAVVISTLLVCMPVFHKENAQLTFIDAMFTAVSAVSVTGLSVVSIPETFNIYGIILIVLLLQIGGVGIMTLGTFLWLLFGKKIGLNERKLIMVDQNRSTLSGMVKLMKEILILIIAIEIIGGIVLGIYYLQFYSTWQSAFYYGMISAVSATTNAGIDFTGESLLLFADDYFVQCIHMLLITLGAIGFPVLMELKEFVMHRGKMPYRFSLFTKLTTTTFAILVAVGVILILFIEFSRFFADKTWHESFFYALFQSVTSRSGGFSTVDIREFSISTHIILSALMFIGASPSSVGGGIRTTTFAIAILSIYSYAKGRNTIKIFNREIDQHDIFKSYVVMMTAMLLCGSSVGVISYMEPALPLEAIVFEVCSAFGTTGLSLGITPELSNVSKVIIMVLMFIGRIGIFSFLFIIRGEKAEDRFHYPKEKVIIG